ncbi:MAG TPA: FAD-dependent monooxygenase [Ktedonobacteraceae bacterium]|nr:FAD-dependent monooxygenase [Ktedonobacteraceae bacterium]
MPESTPTSMAASTSAQQKDDIYDVLVVGASFAGLSFAGVAAALGLRVLLVERDAQVGGVVRTTGVLFSDVLDILDVPVEYLMNEVRRVVISPPTGAPIEISSRAYRFYMADVPGMLGWMAEMAEKRGATLRCGTMFLDAASAGDGTMRVRLGSGSGESDEATEGVAETHAGMRRERREETVGTRFLIGADGARSRVAQCMGLEQNRRFLAGAEWLVDGVTLDRTTFYLVMNHDVAPGYCLWLAPHHEIAALGVAGHARAFNPTKTLRMAQALFQDMADLSNMRIIQQKGGVIPVGGRLHRAYRDDAQGRVLLLGDAAGLCGAATGGGIYPALISGRLAAHAVASEVLNGERGAVKAYLRNLGQAGRLGHYLKIEDWLRWALDRMTSNADVDALYGLFRSPAGHQILQRALLEVPIIGMDSNFFSLLRGLLSKHPGLYSSALQAVWKRVTSGS